MSNENTVTVKIDKELYSKIKEVATNNGQSVKFLVEKAIKESL